VVLRSELVKLGSRAQLTRVLARLVEVRTLIRVGHGVYVKTRTNKFTERLMPAATFEAIVAQTFRKLGIEIKPGALAAEYNSGQSTQLPMVAVVNTGGRRINRRIHVGTRTLRYERDGASPKETKR
jgi:hypothetical protein